MRSEQLFMVLEMVVFDVFYRSSTIFCIRKYDYLILGGWKVISMLLLLNNGFQLLPA
jgi:hypothetical protein